MTLQLPPNIKSQLAAVVDKHAARLGLKLQSQPFLGEHMVFLLPGNRGIRELRLDLAPPYWRDVPLGELTIMRAAIDLLEEFAARHGPGDVWSLAGLPLVHLVEEDGRILKSEVVDGVRLRRLAAHEAQMTERPR